mgnify:CR=1 FL=1
MIKEKQIEALINQMSRLADGVEELNLTIDSNFHSGTFYDGKLVDGLMEIARSIDPKRWEMPKKK